MARWLVRQGGSAPIGPVATELVLKAIEAGRVTSEAEVCRVGTNHWLPLAAYPECAGVVFEDLGPTHVVDSPWFERTESSPSQSRPSVSRSGLGLPPAARKSSPGHRPVPPPPIRPPV